MNFQIFALVMMLLACVEHSLASCVVDSFTVKQDFDPKRVSTQMCILRILLNPFITRSKIEIYSKTFSVYF